MAKKNPHAVALGRLGARKGGIARARKLSPERRLAGEEACYAAAGLFVGQALAVDCNKRTCGVGHDGLPLLPQSHATCSIAPNCSREA